MPQESRACSVLTRNCLVSVSRRQGASTVVCVTTAAHVRRLKRLLAARLLEISSAIHVQCLSHHRSHRTIGSLLCHEMLSTLAPPALIVLLAADAGSQYIFAVSIERAATGEREFNDDNDEWL